MFGLSRINSELESTRTSKPSLPPISLLDVFRDFVVQEWGVLFLYLPVPVSADDKDARTFLQIAKDRELIDGGPWRLRVDRQEYWLAEKHARLYEFEPDEFEVYRLDRSELGRVVQDLIDEHAQSAQIARVQEK